MPKFWIALGLTAAVLAMPAMAKTIAIEPGDNVQEEVQEALILAEPGDVIALGEGRFNFTVSLSLDVDGVTIRGKGMDKTILSFKDQDAGAEGLIITSDKVVCEDFAVEDSKGDAIKAKGSDGIFFIRVRTEWTGGPKETNGAYGLYPVECTDVLIDGCVAIAASDAGIYVGQSENIIVRNSRAEYNVAGIEIENSWGADVYDNVATHNTGGILVFDLPGLPKQGGRDVRVFRNEIINNDTKNFAPAGNIVATVPTGTGLQIMANRNVEVFENKIHGNQSTSISVISYFSSGKPVKDESYDPYPSQIHIHNNDIADGGKDPQGLIKSIIVPLVNGDVPDIMWDGIVKDGVENPEIYIVNNGDADFANLDLGRAFSDPKAARVTRDLAPHKGSLPALKPIVIEGA